MKPEFILLETQKNESDTSILFLFLFLSVIAFTLYFLYKKHMSAREISAEPFVDHKISKLANDCWDSYLHLLKAKGLAKACMNFLTGEGGLQSIVLEMEDENKRYRNKTNKLVFVTHDYDSSHIVNYAVAHGFLKGKEWELPSSLAPGYNTEEAYFASIGYEPHSGSAILAKLQSVKEEQDKETQKYLHTPEIKLVKETFPIIQDFLSVVESNATDDEVLTTRNSFLKQINAILDEYRY